VAVVGAGSWGTTFAHLCAHNAPTLLYSRRPDVAEAINSTRENPRYLPGYALHPGVKASTDLGEVVAEADVLVMGVPSHGFRAMLIAARPHVRAGIPVVSLAKGLEQGTNLRMTQIIEAELPGHPAGVLTGPNLAKEILAGYAAAAVIAVADLEVAERLQKVFATDLFRVYTNTDVVGCEIAGALKNVIALASGMADGLGAGDNTRAAVITRGLAELTRFGVAVGGDPETFAGLAGMGDLVATCISQQSRNRHVGEELGKGRTIDAITAEMDQIAEGVKSAAVIVELARKVGVEMPIAEEVRAVVADERTAEEAYRGLLKRPQTAEVHD
jgi:glycerol-3-phosphate dehydrogenase (NAD(P)+)